MVQATWDLSQLMIEHLAAACSALLGTPLLTWIAAGTIFMAVENRTRAHSGLAASSRWLNVRYGGVHAVAILMLSPLCNVGISEAINLVATRDRLIDLLDLTPSAAVNSALTVVLFVFLADFFYYWWHRLQHLLPLLWDQHAVHHSDETVNTATAVRQHWSEFVFQGFLVSLPVLLVLKTDAATILAASILMHVWSFFNHLDAKVSLGPLSILVSGPQFHLVHHSVEPKHRDKNFAAYLPLWDYLFGTLHVPEPGERPSTGLHSGARIESVPLLTFYPFVMLGRRLRSRLGSPGAAEPDLDTK